MRILKTPEDVAELRAALAVRAASGWAVWDGPERVSGLGPEGFDVVPVHDGALARTADGSRLWRVVSWDERRGAIRLKVRGAFGLVTRTLRIGGEPSAVHAGDWFEEAAGRTLALRFGGECGSLRVVGQRLSGSVRTHGGRQAAVIGIGPDASERLVDDALSAGLVARRRIERSSRSVAELLVMSTAPAIRTVAERLVWLADHARVRLIDITEPLVDVRPHDQGTLVPGGRAFWPNPAKAELKAERTRSRSTRKRRTPERDLAAVVRARLDIVDPSIDPSVVYEQVPARRRGADGYIDMLCVTRRGRLVVIELKATEDRALPLQGLSYWSRVRWHHARGEISRRGYFPGIALDPRPPLLLLVAPRLAMHASVRIVLELLSRDVDCEAIALTTRWRRSFGILERIRVT